MSPFAWLKKRLAYFDIYPITFSYGVNNGDGYKTATAGFLGIIMVLLSLAACSSGIYNALRNMNKDSTSISEGKDESENVYFNTINGTDPRKFSSFMMYSSECFVYHSTVFWEADRDCLKDMATKYVWVENNNYTNSFTGVPTRSPQSIGFFISDCPDEYFDEEYSEYTSSLILDYAKNHTFCYISYDLVFTTSKTFRSIGEGRFTGPSHEEIVKKLDENILKIPQVELDYAASLANLESRKSEMSQEEYDLELYYTNHYFIFFLTYLNLPYCTALRYIVRQESAKPENEGVYGSPLEKETFGFEVIFHYDFESKSFIMNNGIFSNWEVKFKNQKIKSNRGLGIFWRSDVEWETSVVSQFEMARTVQYHKDYGYLFFVYSVENSHDKIDIYYIRVLEVIGEIGGNLGVIAYISIVIMFIKNMMLMRSMANNFFLEKLKDNGMKPYDETILETISLTLRKILPCFFRGFLRPVKHKGQTREAIDYVSEIVDEVLSLENDISSKRKFAAVESALTTVSERALLNQVTSINHEMDEASKGSEN